MPTHFHLILRQNEDRGIERFIANLCNGYTRFFNLRHNRKGPLWQNRFGNTLISTQQELIDTTRYIHLNPTTAYLNENPAAWRYSSFLEYLNKPELPPLCSATVIHNITSKMTYEKYVVDYIEEQRLKKINLRG